jgi:uncharacterized damage-inducible protein DinB
MTTNTANDMLASMFRYQKWANAEMMVSVRAMDLSHHAEQRHLALRTLNHCLVVNKIFVAHLSGQPHGFDADNTPDTPTVDQLEAELAKIDNWYLDYVAKLSPAVLTEPIELTFTDGDKGTMTRQEMLIHVVTHNGYHRGEAGRLMKQAVAISGKEFIMPWDTFAVHLHRGEPTRRQHRQTELSPS